jgi:hypothetical protein
MVQSTHDSIWEGGVDSEDSLMSEAPAPQHLAAPEGEELTLWAQGGAGCGLQAELGGRFKLDAVAEL